ncbi:antitermination regulator [Streptomyces bungoensis]|uniref:Antitermination regulator n=1 Tax=Streptomyces bungoensis TaxID=285568 RepID=A0A101SXZ6_9ACTN|nr:antitermination regulator [Streptomyces bungoensis]
MAHAGVARAEKLLTSRYRLSSEREAFDLLRRSSQKFNIKLHTLADVAIRLRGPAPGAPVWVPSRPQGPAPAIPVLGASGSRPESHSAVLTSALRQALRVTGAHMGNVQLVENGMLRMEKHVGLNRQFTDYFAFVEASTTSCAQAAEESRQVTVKDVAASDTFDEASREAILETGSRACHSTPLLSPNGTVIGMISSHHERPLHDLTPAQLTAMHDLGTQVGRWLLWHRNTAVLTALNHLHADATGKSRSA